MLGAGVAREGEYYLASFLICLLCAHLQRINNMKWKIKETNTKPTPRPRVLVVAPLFFHLPLYLPKGEKYLTKKSIIINNTYQIQR